MILKNWKMIASLSKNDIKSKFAGSYLGIFWAFIQPIVVVLVYWFVFQVGFRSGEGSEYPFVFYLISGIIPWFYFSEALSGGAASFLNYSFLVKKVVFNIEILPVVKIISALFVHGFFIAFAIILFAFNGIYPNIFIFLLLYYILCNMVLALGLSYLCASISVLFKDMIQFINIVVLQLGMWVTPIMWDAESMLLNHPKILFALKLNPVYYIVDGFRDVLLYRQFGLEDKLLWTLYFWIFSILMFVFGWFVFKRLRPHFADVM